MKAYTNLEQSKNLAEILPLKTADMHYVRAYFEAPIKSDDIIPCWSLAALLEEIPDVVINKVGEDLTLHIEKDSLKYSLFYENEYTGEMFEIETDIYDDFVDACYEMILILKEKDLI